MKLGSIGSSLVRWFRKSEAAVPPTLEVGHPGGDEVLIEMLKRAGLYHPSMKVEVRSITEPSGEPAPSRLGVRPPADEGIDNASWEWWEVCRGNQRVPGWAYCRFANRVGDKAVFAFGYVRGSFGIWQKPFRTCNGVHPDVVKLNRVLTVGTHLLTGHAIGNFESLAIAAEACELADRVAAEWATATRATALDPAIHRTQQAWAGAGIVPSSVSHAHEDDGDLLLILGRSIESVMEGKPERLS